MKPNDEPHRISEQILNFIKDSTNDEEFCVENLRLGLGLCLSSIHAAMLYGAKTEESQQDAVRVCMDTIERMIGCLKRDIEQIGIEGVQIISMSGDEGAHHAH